MSAPVAQALQPVFAGAVHEVVARIGWGEVSGLAGIGADRFGAETERVAFVDQKAHAVGIGAGRVLAGLVEILVGDRVGAL